MPDIKKTFRFDEETADKLEELARENGITQSEALRRAIRNASFQQENAVHEPDSHTLAALIDQLAVKDQQIESLTRMAESLTDSLKAAQALHGAAVKDQILIEDTAEEPEPEPKKRSLWQRLTGR